MKLIYLFPAIALILIGCGQETSGPRRPSGSPPLAASRAYDDVVEGPEGPLTKPLPRRKLGARKRNDASRVAASRVVAAARKEVAKKAGYDPAYFAIKYPGGDVPGGGACTDLVVRALRAAGHDLQKLVYEDKTANGDEYPKLWTREVPDSNIDHRRVPNLMCFMKRKGQWLERSKWKTGDIVFWSLGVSGRKHCGVISDRRGKSGNPLVIHNISGAAEEDCLKRWTVIGHARYPRSASPPVVAKAVQKKRPVEVDEDDVPKG